jgi:ubiquitin-protein ligase
MAAKYCAFVGRYDGRNGGWSPALTINKVALSLRSMLASNSDKVETLVNASAVHHLTPKLCSLRVAALVWKLCLSCWSIACFSL